MASMAATVATVALSRHDCVSLDLEQGSYCSFLRALRARMIGAEDYRTRQRGVMLRNDAARQVVRLWIRAGLVSNVASGA